MTVKPAPPSSSSADRMPSLSFDALHYAKLAPRQFLQAHLPAARPSGRSPTAARPPTAHTGSLTHAHGSAVVRIGDTAVVCGVRGETLLASETLLDQAALQRLAHVAVSQESKSHESSSQDCDPQNQSASNPSGLRPDAAAISDLHLVVPNIELATGCNPIFLPGNPPSTLAQSLSQRVLSLLALTDLIRLQDLIIWADEEIETETSSARQHYDTSSEAMDTDHVSSTAQSLRSKQPIAFWVLYLDILFISLSGAAFDAAWMAMLAALQATKLPKARWDGDRDLVLCNPDPALACPLTCRARPVPLTFAIFEHDPRADATSTSSSVAAKADSQSGPPKPRRDVLVDPDDFEESCCAASATVVVDDVAADRIWRIEAQGGPAITAASMAQLAHRAGLRWQEWAECLAKAGIQWT